MSEQERWDALLRQVAEQNERHRKAQQRREEMQRRHWQKLAGSRFEEILESADGAARSLADPAPNVRICAADVLTGYWNIRPGSDHAEQIRRMAFGDIDARVRSCALWDIARCYRGTDDVDLGRWMALLATDSAMTIDERKSAYCGLFRLRDVPFGGGVDASNDFSIPSLRISEDIDWNFVDSFLVEGRQPSPGVPSSWSIEFFGPTQAEWFQFAKPGIDALEAGRYEQAIRLLSDAMRIYPEVPDLLGIRARALRKLGRLDEALQDLTRWISMAPSSTVAYKERGLVYLDRGQLELAKADFRKGRNQGR